MTCLIGACLAAATLLFVVSLPLGLSQFGKALRRGAGALFLAAVAPAVACGIFTQVVGQGGGRHLSIVGILAGIGVLAILSTGAYLVLAVRGRIRVKHRRDRPGWQDRRGYQYGDEPGGRW